MGGIQPVTLGDEEARRRGTQKTVLERKAPPTFDVLVEIVERDSVIVHRSVAETVDAILRGHMVPPEARSRDETGEVRIATKYDYRISETAARARRPSRRSSRPAASAPSAAAVAERRARTERGLRPLPGGAGGAAAADDPGSDWRTRPSEERNRVASWSRRWPRWTSAALERPIGARTSGVERARRIGR